MEAEIKNMSGLERLLAHAEFNRFGIICVVLTVVGCLGGIVVGLGAIQNTIALISVVIPTMVTLSMLIAVAPMRYLLFSASACILIDLSLMLFYLFS
jgi:hypothetical protein